MEKRGQFYIIAAIIIIAVLIGVVALNSQTGVKKQYTKIYDLGEELESETGSVYDYGIYNGNDTDALIGQWAESYYEYSKGGAVEDWIFIYGNKENMTALTFTTVSKGKVGIWAGNKYTGVDIIKGEPKKGKISPGEDNEVTVRFKDFDYDFELNEGENFFFVIKSGGSSARG